MTCGMSVFIDKPAEKDATSMTVLRLQGAVPFVKTNAPQTKDRSNTVWFEK